MADSRFRLNLMRPATGAASRRKRVGRGTGSGRGKTAGRGHKGQLSRSGKSGSAGFEGGQMPLQRRIPKRGFRSRRAPSWLRLPVSLLDRLDAADREIDIALLRERGIIASYKKRVKVYLSGSVQRPHVLRGIAATAGAAAAIKAAGGRMEPAAAATAPKEAG